MRFGGYAVTKSESITGDGFAPYKDLKITMQGHVATVEMCREPHNFFDQDMLSGLADVFEHFDEVDACRALVLAARGKSFCAGADFSKSGTTQKQALQSIYAQTLRLFRTRKPIVAAVQGSAIGGGLGLSLVADFRVTTEDTRFCAIFTKLGFHPGFGLSVTLPRLIGIQQATLLMLTGRRIGGAQAVALGLADVLAKSDELLESAQLLAKEIASNAPLAIMATRQTLRNGLAHQLEAAINHESHMQQQHFQTDDFKEGIAATAERRNPVFHGR